MYVQLKLDASQYSASMSAHDNLSILHFTLVIIQAAVRRCVVAQEISLAAKALSIPTSPNMSQRGGEASPKPEASGSLTTAETAPGSPLRKGIT